LSYVFIYFSDNGLKFHERLVAEFSSTGLTTGPDPMACHRAELRRQGILSPNGFASGGNGQMVRIAGCVTARQRPGTAKGFVFLSVEDETGIANVIITPDVFEQNRVVVSRSRFLMVEGPLQKQGGVIHVKAARMVPLPELSVAVCSRDFYWRNRKTKISTTPEIGTHHFANWRTML
jgi:error-prone DNA polymerase